MATFTTADGDDGEPRLSDEQWAALLRAISTPALTASLERMHSQFRSIAAQVNGSFGRAVAAQLEPVLRASRIQTLVGESLQPLIAQQLNTRKLMEPMLAQIASQQQHWAETLAVPLMANPQLQARMASMLVTPELTEALQRINEIARVHLELPDTDGIDRVSGLIDSGEIDATTLETAEAGVGSDSDMAAAIDEVAEVLARERPWMSRARARQVVIVWVWLMWTAALVAIAVAAPLSSEPSRAPPGSPAVRTWLRRPARSSTSASRRRASQLTTNALTDARAMPSELIPPQAELARSTHHCP